MNNQFNKGTWAFAFCLSFFVCEKMAMAQSFKGVKLSEKVNSSADELAPILSSDGQTMYFVRNGHPSNIGGQDVWFSTKEKGEWSLARNLGEPINNRQDNGIGGVSKSGNELLLTNQYLPQKHSLTLGVSAAKRDNNNAWLKPTTVISEQLINKGNYFGFYATPAADVMILAMATEENSTNEDLFVSFFKNGQWTVPLPLGSEINTAAEELAPFLSKDGKTLFFASKGLGGQGNVDIFVSKRLDDTWTRWEKPVNLGAEVNRSGFDAYFSMDEKEEIAYFVSGESDADLGDIYSVAIKDIPVLNPKPVEPPVVARQEEPAPTPAPEPKPEPKLEVVLENFKNILFDFNKHSIKPSEGKKLDKLAKFLSKNPTVQVVLKGHTDAVGGEDFNNQLSQKRCESSQEYLIEKGIEASRISIEKFGEKKPVSSNKSSQGRQLNRRVEVVVSAE